MKITMYELLGMVKDGKAPKRIKYGNVIYKKMNIDNYEAEDFNIKLFDYNFFQESRLNDEVEILEEEKKIPEKLKKYHFHNRQRQLANKINEIIDYLKSKGYEIKEIKEILDKCTPFLFGDEVDKLTYYITNLQESEAYYYGQYKDYKSRCEKTIEYIKENCIDDEFEVNLTRKEKNIKYALKILESKVN